MTGQTPFVLRICAVVARINEKGRDDDIPAFSSNWGIAPHLDNFRNSPQKVAEHAENILFFLSVLRDLGG
jgi:hypothetical protein